VQPSHSAWEYVHFSHCVGLYAIKSVGECATQSLCTMHHPVSECGSPSDRLNTRLPEPLMIGGIIAIPLPCISVGRGIISTIGSPSTSSPPNRGGMPGASWGATPTRRRGSCRTVSETGGRIISKRHIASLWYFAMLFIPQLFFFRVSFGSPIAEYSEYCRSPITAISATHAWRERGLA
jgi:hypothetical protein